MIILTDTVSVCQVKAYHTEVTATCHCMAPIQTHDPKTHLTTILDIYDLLSENPTLCANTEFELEAYLPVQVVSHLNSDH